MTSYNGTETGFSNISDNYLYLDVNDSDVIYNSDISVGQLRKNGIPEELYENGSVLSNLTIRNFNNANALLQAAPRTPVSSTKTTIYDLISQYPELSECKRLIDSASYQHMLTHLGPQNTHTTFFAFTNENAGLASIWLKRFNTLGYQREFLKAHTTSFTADPILFKGKIIKIFTKSEGNDLYVNGRAIPMYFYTDSKELNGITYSPPMIKVNILGFVTCDNGALYIIDRPFYPQIVL